MQGGDTAGVVWPTARKPNAWRQNHALAYKQGPKAGGGTNTLPPLQGNLPLEHHWRRRRGRGHFGGSRFFALAPLPGVSDTVVKNTPQHFMEAVAQNAQLFEGQVRFIELAIGINIFEHTVDVRPEPVRCGVRQGTA